MVVLGEGREREADKLMAMAPERSKPLRNPGITFTWGTRRCLRCVKVNPNGEATGVDRKSAASEVERGFGRRDKPELERRGSSDRRESFKVPPLPSAAVVGCSGRKSTSLCDVDDEIEAVRTKLTFDLQTAANRIKDAIQWEGLEMEPPAPTVPSDSKAEMPWNLRTRRAASKEPNGISGYGNVGGNDGGGKSFKADMLKPNFPPLRTETITYRLRGSVTDGTAAPSGQKRERAQFSISLSRGEIEEDFMAMTGQKLPRRPKKRAKNLQKDLDKLFPGMWLKEVNADIYKVPDVLESGKR